LPYGGEDLSTSVGGFAAANFIWKNRYVIDGSYRLSGSSKFGSDKRTAPFWSTGLGYNLHNENFIRDLGFVDLLRIRGSYGYTGSVKFDSYQAISTYFYSVNYLHYAGVGAIPMGMANPDLTWQTTKKFNIGLTSSLLSDRVNVNLDYYRETTDDMLIDVSLPPSSGASSVKNNFGKQRSNGIEFSLWGKIIQTRDWGWNLSVNGLHSKTTILNISDALKRKNENNSQVNDEVAPRLQFREGESPTAIYAVRSAGIDPASGKEIFIKKDGSYTYEYDAADQVACGDTNPILQGTISSLLTWKNLSFNMNFSYRFGGDMYNSTRMVKVENIDPKYNVDVRAFTERWKKPGDRVPYLAISQNGGQTFSYSDRFIEKDNELWLSSITLQYNVPQNWISPLGLQRLYVSAGAEDLFRLTSAKYERGTAYPFSRNVNLSLSVTF
ncbi:MAG: TonB-dependent receptor, partial [Duncaniella sp.]